MNGEYIILDTETTYDSETKTEKIIELSAIRIDANFNILSEFHKLINPQIPLTWITKKVTGITNESLRTCPVFGEVILELSNFLGNSLIIAHNALFDSKVLKEHFEDQNSKLNNIFVDSLKMSKDLVSLKKNSLSELKSYFSINIDSHRAEKDTLSLLEILKQLDIIYKDKMGKPLLSNISGYGLRNEKQKLLTI